MEADRRRKTTAATRDEALAKAVDLVARLSQGRPTDWGQANGDALVANYLDPARRPARGRAWSARHRGAAGLLRPLPDPGHRRCRTGPPGGASLLWILTLVLKATVRCFRGSRVRPNHGLKAHHRGVDVAGWPHPGSFHPSQPSPPRGTATATQSTLVWPELKRKPDLEHGENNRKEYSNHKRRNLRPRKA